MHNRFERLKAHLQQGGTRYTFARREGVSRQAITNWLKRRPDYVRQLEAYGKTHKSAPVVGEAFKQRVGAVREKYAHGVPWKVAGHSVGLTGPALAQWYYCNRDAVDKAA